jgi:uncharacterized protein (TIGR03000 family)
VAPATRSLPAPAATNSNAATVTIKAPTDVRVSVDGQDTERTSSEETFTTPDLQRGRTYQYVFQAEATRDGKKITLTKRVTVQAGGQSEVDFSDLAAPAADVAKVTVMLPNDAKLFIDGVECPLTSNPRIFETPRLEAGRQYYYTLKAEVVRDGRTKADSRRVVVEAGRTTQVEFKDLEAVQSASR